MTLPHADILPRTASRVGRSADTQPYLPIKLTAKRPSDRILARVIHDRRIPADGTYAVATVLATFISYDDETYTTFLKETTLAHFAHCDIRSVRRHKRHLADLGVIAFALDGRRNCTRFTFLLDWVASWTPEDSERETAPVGKTDRTQASYRPSTDRTQTGGAIGHEGGGDRTQVSYRLKVVPSVPEGTTSTARAVPDGRAEGEPVDDDRTSGHLTAAGTISSGQLRAVERYGVTSDCSSYDAHRLISARGSQRDKVLAEMGLMTVARSERKADGVSTPSPYKSGCTRNGVLHDYVSAGRDRQRCIRCGDECIAHPNQSGNSCTFHTDCAAVEEVAQ